MREFTWSSERPQPSSLDKVPKDKLYLQNVLVVHKSIARKLAKFYSSHMTLWNEMRTHQAYYNCKPNTWASVLERVTSLFFMMLLMSEDGRGLRVESVPIESNAAGQGSCHVDIDGRVYM